MDARARHVFIAHTLEIPQILDHVWIIDEVSLGVQLCNFVIKACKLGCCLELVSGVRLFDWQRSLVHQRGQEWANDEIDVADICTHERRVADTIVVAPTSATR